MTETLEAQLANAKAELLREAQGRALIDCGGPWAEQIFYETAPEADSIAGVSFHEAGHYVVAELVGLPAVMIQVRLCADRHLRGVVSPTWDFMDPDPEQTDAVNLGSRIQLCGTVGIHLDLDEILARAGVMIRDNWPRVQRIGAHLESLCRTQTGPTWRVVISAQTIDRLFWPEAAWVEWYGRGICA
ncbi:MAG: hypothetical protein LAP85_10520 [Acidobacteriia bacterium]|nr:hypothetical protein [Terriglobia bacterium]